MVASSRILAYMEIVGVVTHCAPSAKHVPAVSMMSQVSSRHTSIIIYMYVIQCVVFKQMYVNLRSLTGRLVRLEYPIEVAALLMILSKIHSHCHTRTSILKIS